jgi:hypothetical protein
MGALDVIGYVVPLAHDIGVPHQDPQPQSDGGGASPLVVGAGVAATLALTGGLIWVRERSRKADAASAALEGDAHADGDEQGAGPALEPGDHARPGQEPA